MLLVIGIIISGCSKKNSTTTTPPKLIAGEYAATGTITLSSGGVNYSMPMSSIQIVTSGSNSILLKALDSTTVGGYGSISMQINSSTSSLNIGTYKIPGTTNVCLIKFTDKTHTPYTASPAISGTSATINITSLTSTSIKGTFTATLVSSSNNSGTSISITTGVIDCTY